VSICSRSRLVVVVFPIRCVVLLYRTLRGRWDSAAFPDVGTGLQCACIAAFLTAPYSFIFVLRVQLTTPHTFVPKLGARCLHTNSSRRVRRLASHLGPDLLFSVPVQRSTRMGGKHLSLIFKPHRSRWRSNVRHHGALLYRRWRHTSETIAIHARSQHAFSLRRHTRCDRYCRVPQLPWRNLYRMVCNRLGVNHRVPGNSGYRTRDSLVNVCNLCYVHIRDVRGVVVIRSRRDICDSGIAGIHIPEIFAAYSIRRNVRFAVSKREPAHRFA